MRKALDRSIQIQRSALSEIKGLAYLIASINSRSHSVQKEYRHEFILFDKWELFLTDHESLKTLDYIAGKNYTHIRVVNCWQAILFSASYLYWFIFISFDAT